MPLRKAYHVLNVDMRGHGEMGGVGHGTTLLSNQRRSLTPLILD
jgi:hypothetical protein